MQKSLLLFLTLILLFYQGVMGQADTVSSVDSINKLPPVIKGKVIDVNTHQPLSYANIYVLHKNKGTISNENGEFLLETHELSITDTVSFRFVGYYTKNYPLNQPDTMITVALKEEVFSLNEFVVYANTPDARDIVRKIVENLDINYPDTPSKKQLFIRQRFDTELLKKQLQYKKSSIPDFDKAMIRRLENNIPKHTISYSDLLGDFYFSASPEDTAKMKVNPLRTVALKDKSLAKMDEIIRLFESNLKNTSEGEYWKVKSGIIGQKLDLKNLENDSSEAQKDSLKENTMKVKYLKRRIHYYLQYSTLKDDVSWEFLYKTRKYHYWIIGGTKVNGEEVYIIDFEPDGSGMYRGRMFVTAKTFALIKADYEYAQGRTGTDFNLLGVGYTEDLFKGSIYFEKEDGHYHLKYFSKKEGATMMFDRNLALIKKKERFLFDKTLQELKLGVRMDIKSEQLVEFLVLNDTEISHQDFLDFQEPETGKIIYVDKFDNTLWKGYSIIEPTQKMREYRKQTGVQELGLKNEQ